MSRRAQRSDFVFVVGWDPPLQTFFGQVFIPATADESCVWVGADPGVQLRSVQALKKALGQPWASLIDADVERALLLDKINNVA